MAKTIYCNSKWILLSLLLLLGCVKDEVVGFDPANKEWITIYSMGDNFAMRDDNGISQSFVLTENSHYFTESSGGILFVTTHRSETEYHYQLFTSSHGSRFSLSLTASTPQFGDHIFIEFNGIGFDYDLRLKNIFRISSPFGYLSKTITDTGYDNDVTIKSTVRLLDSYTVNQAQYAGVLHFTLRDFEADWGPFTVKEIFVAKKYGLIKYVYNNGLTVERQ